MNTDDVYLDTPESEPRVKSQLPSNGAAVRKLRSSREYQRPREEFRYRARAHHNPDGTKGEPCWLCGEAIDYRLTFPHPRSWSLDHVIPVAENPALMLNVSNWRSAHLDCNNHRQTGELRLGLGIPSEIW
jgi:hypothetical protein